MSGARVSCHGRFVERLEGLLARAAGTNTPLRVVVVGGGAGGVEIALSMQVSEGRVSGGSKVQNIVGYCCMVAAMNCACYLKTPAHAMRIT